MPTLGPRPDFVRPASEKPASPSFEAHIDFHAKHSQCHFIELSPFQYDQPWHEVTFFVTLLSISENSSNKNKKATLPRGFLDFGGSGEIRTRDQRIKSPLLYRLSYRPFYLTSVVTGKAQNFFGYCFGVKVLCEFNRIQ